MKKAILIGISVILLIAIIFFAGYFILTTPKDSGDFSVNEYQENIENVHFKTDKNYGVITDYKSAAKAGKQAILDRFEDSAGGLFEWMGCDVRYDEKNNAYCVYTYHVNPLVMGGVYAVILQSDGTVLAIWGEK
jgi:hypothetical protein